MTTERCLEGPKRLVLGTSRYLHDAARVKSERGQPGGVKPACLVTETRLAHPHDCGLAARRGETYGKRQHKAGGGAAVPTFLGANLVKRRKGQAAAKRRIEAGDRKLETPSPGARLEVEGSALLPSFSIGGCAQSATGSVQNPSLVIAEAAFDPGDIPAQTEKLRLRYGAGGHDGHLSYVPYLFLTIPHWSACVKRRP